MKTKNDGWAKDLLPRDRFIEKLLPEAHVGCEEVGFHCLEKVEGKISKDKEGNDNGHRANDRTDGVLHQGREKKSKGGDDRHRPDGGDEGEKHSQWKEGFWYEDDAKRSLSHDQVAAAKKEKPKQDADGAKQEDQSCRIEESGEVFGRDNSTP